MLRKKYKSATTIWYKTYPTGKRNYNSKRVWSSMARWRSEMACRHRKIIKHAVWLVHNHCLQKRATVARMPKF
jgi:hypothetical protein